MSAALVTDVRPLRIVGVDLSLRATGVATSTFAITICSDGEHDATYQQRDQRLSYIRRNVLQSTAAADLVVIEGPSYGSTGGSAFDRAGLFWLVYRGLAHRDIPVVVVSPKTRAKYATGNGNADKDAVLVAAVRRFPNVGVTGNNAADALILAAMGYDHYGSPLAPMPATHRAALNAVDWPELVTP